MEHLICGFIFGLSVCVAVYVANMANAGGGFQFKSPMNQYEGGGLGAYFAVWFLRRTYAFRTEPHTIQSVSRAFVADEGGVYECGRGVIH